MLYSVLAHTPFKISSKIFNTAPRSHTHTYSCSLSTVVCPKLWTWWQTATHMLRLSVSTWTMYYCMGKPRNSGCLAKSAYLIHTTTFNIIIYNIHNVFAPVFENVNEATGRLWATSHALRLFKLSRISPTSLLTWEEVSQSLLAVFLLRTWEHCRKCGRFLQSRCYLGPQLELYNFLSRPKGIQKYWGSTAYDVLYI